MNRIKHGSLVLALQILLLPAVLLTMTTLLFWLTVSITIVHFLLSLIITIAISFLVVKKYKHLQPAENVKGKDFLIITAVFLLLILVTLFISMGVYDFSQDGQVYHQPGVMALAKGWNPFHEPFLEKYNRFYKRALAGNEIFVNHYPKASWIAAAAIYKLTGSLEGGKLFNFLYLAAVFLITWHFLFRFQRIPGASKVIISALAALNPVVLYQLFSFYNDGQLASLTTITTILAFHYVMFREKNVVAFLFITLLTLINIKFTGLVYGAVIVVMAWLAVFIIDKNLQGHFIRAISAALVIAVVIIGYQPYISNVIHKGNPFYPSIRKAAGKNASYQNVIVRQAPEAFIKKERFSKLFYSLFSKSDHRMHRMPQLKIPFSIHDVEMRTFNEMDARYGGFGPLFGSVLLLVAAAAVFVLLKAKRLVLLFIFIPVGMILISTLINPEAWWARLAPQLWLLPIAFIVGFHYSPGKKLAGYIMGFALSILLLNSFVVLAKHTDHTLTLNRRFKNQMTVLSKETRQKGKVLLVAPDVFYLPVQDRLQRFNIKHRMVKKLKSPQKARLIGTPNVKICFED